MQSVRAIYHIEEHMVGGIILNISIFKKKTNKKPFNNIQYPFMIKNQTKNRNILLQTGIEYLVKPTANILLTSKILNTFPLILRAMLSDLCSYLYSKCKGYKHCNKARKRNKSHKD